MFRQSSRIRRLTRGRHTNSFFLSGERLAFPCPILCVRQVQSERLRRKNFWVIKQTPPLVWSDVGFRCRGINSLSYFMNTGENLIPTYEEKERKLSRIYIDVYVYQMSLISIYDNRVLVLKRKEERERLKNSFSV